MKTLREGFTTGTAATAAAMAALHLLLGKNSSPRITTPLPPFYLAQNPPPHLIFFSNSPLNKSTLPKGETLTPSPKDSSPLNSWPTQGHLVPSAYKKIPIASQQIIEKQTAAWAIVCKDGGDDPDATHKALIKATVRLLAPTHEAGQASHAPTTAQGTYTPIILEGGEGVGRITLPGLPLPVGSWAINPIPRLQILYGLRLVAEHYKYCGPLHVTISVPEGQSIAKHTFNPRLGIVGGISILGTQGTVKAFSHKAWQATILQGLHVAAATNCATVCLSTGRRSERLLMAQYPQLTPQSFIQAADFAYFSLKKAGYLGFSHLVWGCFFGKLVKLAQGHPNTHARKSPLNFSLLATWCQEAGSAHAEAIANCTTAGHVLEILMQDINAFDIIQVIAQKAQRVASAFANMPVTIHVFHLNGTELVKV